MLAGGAALALAAPVQDEKARTWFFVTLTALPVPQARRVLARRIGSGGQRYTVVEVAAPFGVSWTTLHRALPAAVTDAGTKRRDRLVLPPPGLVAGRLYPAVAFRVVDNLLHAQQNRVEGGLGQPDSDPGCAGRGGARSRAGRRADVRPSTLPGWGAADPGVRTCPPEEEMSAGQAPRASRFGRWPATVERFWAGSRDTQ